MNERASCTNCVHRRPITAMSPSYTVCHYLIDTSKVRGCSAANCNHWQSVPKSEEQWLKLLDKIREDS